MWIGVANEAEVRLTRARHSVMSGGEKSASGPDPSDDEDED
jgi:hypothetical protein